MADLHDEKDMNMLLSNAVWDSRKRMEPFQKQVLKLVKEFVGRDYGEEIVNQVDRQPINKMAFTIITYLHRLMSDNPRVLLTTKKPELQQHALEREAVLNEWIIRTNAVEQLTQVVMSALFGFGIFKVGVTLDRAKTHQDPGEVRVWSIGIDDYVRDMLCKSREEMAFEGMRYRVPTKRLLADPTIHDDDKKRISPTPRTAYNEFGNQKIETIAEGVRFPLELQDYTELWEIWLPELQEIRTFVGTYSSSMFDPEPIKVVQWEGPTNGPYHELAFHPVLDNIIPKPPVSLYSDLNWAMNSVCNKLIRQGIGQKKILLFPKGQNPGDIEAVNTTGDGGSVSVSDPQLSVERSFGGPDQVNAALLVQLIAMFNPQSGNVDQIAGLASEAPTAHQEELLAQSSSLSLNAMQSKVMNILQRVFTDAAFWLFRDPHLNIIAQKKIGNTNTDMSFTMTPDTIKGEPDDFFIEITPYSHVFRTPQDRWNNILGILQAILPMAQAAGAGAPLDIQEILRLAARYNDCPEIQQIWVSQDGGANSDLQGAQNQGPTQGAQNSVQMSSTEHIRKDRGGPPSQAEQSTAMLNTLSKLSPVKQAGGE